MTPSDQIPEGVHPGLEASADAACVADATTLVPRQAHTPGPWVVKFAKGSYPYQIDAPNGSRGPGGITSVTRWGAISFPSSPEGRANARLMAASPDLLCALKGAIGALEFSLDYHRDLGNEDIAFAADRLDAAKSAIAKATGDQ